MPEFTTIDRQRDDSTSAELANKPDDQLDEADFGTPPTLLIGLITATVGAVAGLFSLMIFFYVWEPDHYVSPDWFVFVLLGGLIGFFLRLERPIIRELYRRMF